MAKVWYKFGIGAVSGTLADGTHMPAKSHLVGYMRRWVMPKLTINNTHFGTIAKNLKLVWANASADYKANALLYAQRYATQYLSEDQFNPAFSPYAWWTQMMFAWAVTDPLHIDLTTVTVADIVTSDAEVRTWERAIDAGYIRTITLYSDLTDDIQ
jgi:hypothetical protein